MSKYVLTHNDIIGFHYYPNPPEFCAYLGNIHRHNFVIDCEFEVSTYNREIEINEMQLVINNDIEQYFGKPADFGDFSCENIAAWIINKYPKCIICSVREDGYGGAKITR